MLSFRVALTRLLRSASVSKCCFCQKCVCHILMHVKSNTSLRNYSNKFLLYLPIKWFIFYAVVYVSSLREKYNHLPKDCFCRIIRAFQIFFCLFCLIHLFFFFFFMKNDTYLFILHDAWRLRLSSGKRITFNFFAGVLYKLNN